MNRFLFLVIAILSFIFTACEGYTTREYIVKNNTNDTIIVQFQGILFSDEQTEKIGPNSQSSIYYTDQRGGNANPGLVNETFDHVVVYNIFGDSICPNMLENDSWQIDSEQKNKVPSNYYHTFTYTQN